MYFYEFTLIHGGESERKKWDCDDCLSYRLNEQRNCGGKFPNSHWAKGDGYEISDFRINQCPKTFIEVWALEFIRLIDRARITGTPIASSMDLLPNRFVALWEIAEIEKAKARNALDQIQRQREG